MKKAKNVLLKTSGILATAMMIGTAAAAVMTVSKVIIFAAAVAWITLLLIANEGDA